MPWRRIARIAALAVGSLAIYASVAEVWLRIFGSDQYHVWPPEMEITFQPRPEFLPGVSGTARVTINRMGIRGEPFGDDPQYRLLAVGGSTTICVYLDDSEAWPRLVQGRLNAALGPGAAWVGNVGRPGHTSAQHVLQVDKLLEQHPQLDGVLLLVGVNDLLVPLSMRMAAARRSGGPPIASADPISRAFAVVPRGAVDGPWYRRSALGLYLAMGWFSIPEWDNDIVLSRDGGSIERWREFRRQASRLRNALPNISASLRSYAQNLNGIVNAVRRREARVVFMTQPTLWSDALAPEELDLLWTGGPPLYDLEKGAEYFSAGALADGMRRYNEVLLDTCRKRGVECLDLAARLPREAAIFYDDAHFTEEGARRVAELVAGHLLAIPPLADRARPAAD